MKTEEQAKKEQHQLSGLLQHKRKHHEHFQDKFKDQNHGVEPAGINPHAVHRRLESRRSGR